MADPNYRDFYGRVARIERGYRRGRGFEAPGTLGRSYYTRRQGYRLPVLGPVLVLVLGLVCLKAVIHHTVGAATYDSKVAALWQGDAVDRVGAAIMQADPATKYLSRQIRLALN